MVSLLDPAAPGLIPTNPEIFSLEKITKVAQVDQRHCLEDRRQWLENVDQTHLALASGKLVLQNRAFTYKSLKLYNTDPRLIIFTRQEKSTSTEMKMLIKKKMMMKKHQT